MIRIAEPVFSDSLTYILNQPFILSVFPDEWKTPGVTTPLIRMERILSFLYDRLYVYT